MRRVLLIFITILLISCSENEIFLDDSIHELKVDTLLSNNDVVYNKYLNKKYYQKKDTIKNKIK